MRGRKRDFECKEPDMKSIDTELARHKVDHTQKHQYRSEIGIISDVLCATMDGGRNGVIISSIARRANLSHYTAMEKCQKLTALGLMESIESRNNRTFAITERGILFFQEMQKFMEVIEEIKIRF